jgi:hypothetical protein
VGVGRDRPHPGRVLVRADGGDDVDILPGEAVENGTKHGPVGIEMCAQRSIYERSAR